MYRSILMGLVAGQRAMTPLSALAGAARRGAVHDNPATRLMARPLFAAGGVAMAVTEMVGDKTKTAPDRTVFLGLLARTITGGFAGGALAPKRQMTGAALGAGAAILSSYAGLALRKRAMRRWGQTASGFAEDALVLAAANAIAHTARRTPRG
jgi:uncharacterized membrane protein